MESINILNIHAGIKADTRETISPKFYSLFADFIDAWKGSGFSSDYLDDGVKEPLIAAVHKAYWAFHEFLAMEERRKREEARKKEEVRNKGVGEVEGKVEGGSRGGSGGGSGGGRGGSGGESGGGRGRWRKVEAEGGMEEEI